MCRFFALVVIVSSNISPAMSQSVNNPCREGFIQIIKPSENDIPLKSCVLPSMVEAFSKLGWQVAPPNSNMLFVIFEKAGRCAEAIGNEISQANKCYANDENCYFLQEPILACLGEKVTVVAEEIIGDVEVVIEKVDEIVEKIE